MNQSTLTYMNILFVLCTLVLPSYAFAQDDLEFSRETVKNMFGNTTKNVWINSLSGKLDGQYGVDMIIGTDGNVCQGIYRMQTSGIIFYFEGQDNEHKISLTEMTQSGQTTGFITGIYDGSKLNGVWEDKTKKLSYDIVLEFVYDFENVENAPCESKEWIRYYRGKVEGNELVIMLQKKEYVYNYSVWSNSIKVTHKNNVYKSDKIVLLDFDNISLTLDGKAMMLNVQTPEKLSILSLEESGYQSIISMEEFAKVYSICEAYGDYYSLFLSELPMTGNKKFDNFIQVQVKEWKKEQLEELKKIQIEDISSSDRWVQRITAWTELSLFTPSMISGTIYMQSSQKIETKKIPFIFDLKSSKILQMNDIFESKSNILVEVSAWKEKEKKNKHNESIWKNHFCNEEFTHFILHEDGIHFTSEFSTIYGEQKLVLPYPKIADKIKYAALIDYIRSR